MTDYIWPLIAALGLVLAYRVIMQWIGNAPPEEIATLRQEIAGARDGLGALRTEFHDHARVWDTIGQQWRAKVLELEQKTDRVVIDAKNEIAGSVAQVADITKKGWR